MERATKEETCREMEKERKNSKRNGFETGGLLDESIWKQDHMALVSLGPGLSLNFSTLYPRVLS